MHYEYHPYLGWYLVPGPEPLVDDDDWDVPTKGGNC
jgi:hypothetical protein